MTKIVGIIFSGSIQVLNNHVRREEGGVNKCYNCV